VKYGNKLSRSIFAIPFGIAAIGYGLAGSKLPKKDKRESNDDNYIAFRPRTVAEFESGVIPDYKPSLRGNLQQASVQETSSTYNGNCTDCDTFSYWNPYSTGKARRRRNRRKRRNSYNF